MAHGMVTVMVTHMQMRAVVGGVLAWIGLLWICNRTFLYETDRALIALAIFALITATVLTLLWAIFAFSFALSVAGGG